MTMTISGTAGLTFPDTSTMTTGQQACKAWVNFNGTGTGAGTQTIRASFNVSSITRGGIGTFVVNLTNALADANGAALATAIPGTAASINYNRYVDAAVIAANQVRVNVLNVSANGFEECEFVSAAVFR